jgi:hypothetical protein
MTDNSTGIESGVSAERGKWGFHVERNREAKRVFAKDLIKTTDDGSPTDYDMLRDLIQRRLVQVDNRYGTTVKSNLERKHAKDKTIDIETFLTRLNEAFKFSIGSENDYWHGERNCYNFTKTKLTDEHLSQIAEGLGEMHMRSGGQTINLLANIMIIPDNHPLALNPTQGYYHDSGARVFPGFPMIIIDEAALVKRKPSPPHKDNDIVSHSLKDTVLHEATHLWQQAYPQAAKQFETTVVQSNESFPSVYAGEMSVRAGEKRHLEILPEAIVALSTPEFEQLVGPEHRKAVQEFQRDAFWGAKDGNAVARPTLISCHQIDPRSLAAASTPETQRWRRPFFKHR